ncbi:MAG: hypothetical protein V1754_01420, partial [Pseudomonadota bacterium]
LFASSFAFVSFFSGCFAKCSPPQTPEETFSRLTKALHANDILPVYSLLDRQTQWSIISTYEAQKEIASLASRYYPKDRQTLEYQRLKTAVVSGTPREFFATQATAQKLLEPLFSVKHIESKTVTQDRVEIKSGNQILPFCHENNEWFYCGLREYFNDQKVRAARDLAAAHENAKAYLQGE